jgi:putative PIN family toxin of toxin-antitoxin system
MKVVLDTNVLLSALISSHGAPHAIYRAWRADRFELITSTEQLAELRRASRYPKLKAILPSHHVGTMINNLHRTTVLRRLPPHESEIEDPDDAYLISMAIACSADYLVTGDIRAGLLQKNSLGRTRVLSPPDFHRIILAAK